MTIRYIVVLSVIALLAVLGYGIERARRPRASDALVVVIADRQSILGQEITKAALVSASTVSSIQRQHYRAELDEGIRRLQDAHKQLRFGDPQRGIPVENDSETLTILDRVGQDLDRLFVAARALASTAPGPELDDRRSRLLDADAQLISSNSALVQRYADHAVSHVYSSDRIQLALTASLLAVLLLQGLFVFAPAVRKVRDSITTLEETQASLALTAAIVESSGDAIARTSLAGEIQTWNNGAEAMFALPGSEAIGKNISTIVRSESLDAVRQAFAKVAAGEAVPPFDAVATASNGRRTDVSMMIAPILNPEGAVSSVSIIGRDVTERVQAQKMKSDFVSFVSHQLRTPLALNGCSSWLAETPECSARGRGMRLGCADIRRPAHSSRQRPLGCLAVGGGASNNHAAERAA